MSGMDDHFPHEMMNKGSQQGEGGSHQAIIYLNLSNIIFSTFMLYQYQYLGPSLLSQ